MGLNTWTNKQKRQFSGAPTSVAVVLLFTEPSNAENLQKRIQLTGIHTTFTHQHQHHQANYSVMSNRFNNYEIGLPIHKWAAKLNIRIATVHVLIKQKRLIYVGTDVKGRALYAKSSDSAFHVQEIAA